MHYARAFALSLVGSVSASLADTSYGTFGEPAPVPAPNAAPPALITFADAPLKIAEIGLSVKVPANYPASINAIGQITRGTIQSPDRTWSITILVANSADTSMTVVQKSNAILTTYLKPVELKDGNDARTGAPGELVWPASIELSDDRTPNFQIPGCPLPGDRFYVAMATGKETMGVQPPKVVQGFSIFKPSPDRFCTFKLLAPDSKFAEARAVYEAVVATAQFEDPTLLATNRRDAVEAGVAFFRKLTTPEIIAAFPDAPIVLRLYKPASTGGVSDAEEMGYRVVRYWRGTRSELSDNQNIAPADNVAGLMCEVKARIVTRQGLKAEFQVIDTLARFFLTEDRSEEAWSISTTLKDPGQVRPRLLNEVGARRGDSMSISLVETGKPARTVTPLIGGPGYISQFEAYLLPRLLVRSGIELEVGSYAYRSDSESISLRRDVVKRDPQSGAWTVATRFRESDQAQMAIYRESGDLVRAMQPDGSVWEPSDLEAITALWKRKDLPIK